jgi:hypothetical protein
MGGSSFNVYRLTFAVLGIFCPKRMVAEATSAIPLWVFFA